MNPDNEPDVFLIPAPTPEALQEMEDASTNCLKVKAWLKAKDRTHDELLQMLAIEYSRESGPRGAVLQALQAPAKKLYLRKLHDSVTPAP